MVGNVCTKVPSSLKKPIVPSIETWNQFPADDGLKHTKQFSRLNGDFKLK